MSRAYGEIKVENISREKTGIEINLSMKYSAENNALDLARCHEDRNKQCE